jgi:hypothetical protein
MDDIVSRALARWPNVPAVYGWLALDRRGQWSIKGASKAGFARITNSKLIEFIGRNYAYDDQGCWYFQNGPQRVYVKLDYTPIVYRIANPHSLTFETHTGAACATLHTTYMDEAGDLLLVTERGPGLLLDRDLPRALDALSYADGQVLDEERLLGLIEESNDATGVHFNSGGNSVPLNLIRSDEAPARFGYVREPRPADA